MDGPIRSPLARKFVAALRKLEQQRDVSHMHVLFATDASLIRLGRRSRSCGDLPVRTTVIGRVFQLRLDFLLLSPRTTFLFSPGKRPPYEKNGN
jgi:hypothetical protein